MAVTCFEQQRSAFGHVLSSPQTRAMAVRAFPKEALLSLLSGAIDEGERLGQGGSSLGQELR
jgi:hypothetical protein